MIVTVLGSGGSEGIPVPYCKCRVCQSGDTRCRTSYLIRLGGGFLLVEIGPDFRRQQLKYGFPIDYLFVSHEHHDHISGLAELRHIMLVAKIRMRPPRILISKRLHKKLRRQHRPEKEGFIFAYNELVRKRKLIPVLLDYGKRYSFDGFEMEIFRNRHENIACDGFLLGSEGKKIAYIADAGMLYQKNENLINDSIPDLLIANTPFFYSGSRLRAEDHRNARRNRITHHIGIDTIEHLKARKILLSHFSHKSGLTSREIKRKVAEYRNVIAAEDGLEIRV